MVVECSGLLRKGGEGGKELEAGGKKVMMCAGGKEEDMSMVMGVNEEK
ncbi:glyceraldehyde 3-phosphate dehydrogenase NAD-binding domain-containing protein [Bacillus altitudinis]|nr:glyceraldehyde 3-phosphate dehydrogenase NAD-binding domain-containing protein [Bacillus altitudinis]